MHQKTVHPRESIHSLLGERNTPQEGANSGSEYEAGSKLELTRREVLHVYTNCLAKGSNAICHLYFKMFEEYR